MKREDLRSVMNDAWRMFKVTGKSFGECLKKAWAILKLKVAMKTKVVEFWYTKATTGEVRQAFGTMKANMVGEVKGVARRVNEDLLTYWDCEKSAWRSMKKFNLIKVA